MIHLPPLLGYNKSPGLSKIIKNALNDLKTLELGGVDGVMVENEYDRPHKITAGPETVAAMTVVTESVVKHAKKVIVGVEILLNDPCASLAVAKASGASFIRTDYFVDRMSRPEYGGEMHTDPKGVIAYRQTITAQNILILADIQVKYATMLAKKTIAKSARQAKEEHADAIIVTGNFTGESPNMADLIEAKKTLPSYPVLIGSGLTADNAETLLSIADGAVVGTSLKTGIRVDGKKVSKLMAIVNKLRSNRL